ncbi:MAG: hypothetical protein HY808_00400 [Nitrospirae bacterium]|nr:hypothetical protein [Nitrospirota bacterium]
MRRNYFLINIALIIMAGFLGMKFYGSLTKTIDLPSAPGAKQAKEEGASAENKEQALDLALFQVISGADLFRPSRSPAPLVTSPLQAAPKIPPRLFGTIILNDEKSAILEDPSTKATRTYRLNDSIAGFTISDIQEDRVVLLSDGDKTEVRLREEKRGAGAAPARPQPQVPVRPQPQFQPSVQPQVQVPPQQQIQRGVQQRPIRPTPALRNRSVPPPAPPVTQPQPQTPPPVQTQTPPPVPPQDSVPEDTVIDNIDIEHDIDTQQ